MALLEKREVGWASFSTDMTTNTSKGFRIIIKTGFTLDNDLRVIRLYEQIDKLYENVRQEELDPSSAIEKIAQAVEEETSKDEYRKLKVSISREVKNESISAPFCFALTAEKEDGEPVVLSYSGDRLPAEVYELQISVTRKLLFG